MCVVAMFLPPASRFSIRTREQRAERDLERAAGDVDVGVAARGRVQVDAVVADADACPGYATAPCSPRTSWAMSCSTTVYSAGCGATRGCTSALARPSACRRPRRGAGAGPGQARLGLAASTGDDRLSSARRACAVAVGLGHAEHGPAEVVDLRPVHERDVAGGRRPGSKLSAGQDAPEQPQVAVALGVGAGPGRRAPGRRAGWGAACAGWARWSAGRARSASSWPPRKPGGVVARSS